MKSIWNEKMLLIMRKQYVKQLEKKGIDFKTPRKYWNKNAVELKRLSNIIENKDVKYPKYFTETIHTYTNGHLNWQQAYESECHMEGSALMSLKELRPEDYSTIDSRNAYEIYKEHILLNIKDVIEIDEIETLTDFGCGTGSLTRKMTDILKVNKITAVDLSPNYLSIALFQDNTNEKIDYIHGNMENVNIKSETQDVVTICYSFHEMPKTAIMSTIKNAYRILKPKGQLIIVDMNPEKITKYPSFIDISEPHLKEYREITYQDLLKQNKYINIKEKYLHQLSYMFTGFK